MPIPNRIEQFDSLPGSALITAKEIGELAGRSATTIWREVRRNRLPKPIALSRNAVRWRAKDVRTYLLGSIDSSSNETPEQPNTLDGGDQ